MSDGAKLEDSNCAGLGSDADKKLRKEAAETETAWDGCGEKPGVEIWRIEQFQVKKWPEKEYGKFYDGDAYITLLTRKDKVSEALHWDIFFLLGKDCTQDEAGTAAYKTVELDSKLDGQAHQHREVEGEESKEFHSIFPHIHYMTGGMASGFHHVENKQDYEPKLLHVIREKHTTRMNHVPLSKDSMNESGCFILDAGAKIYTYYGSSSNNFERNRADTAAEHMETERDGHAKVIDHTDDEDGFWALLGGKGPIKEEHNDPTKTGLNCATKSISEAMDHPAVLYGITLDASSKPSYTKVGDKNFKNLLDPSGVFLLDAEHQVFVWIGKEAPKEIGDEAMIGAMKYVHDSGRPISTPIKLFREGKIINNTTLLRILND